MLFAVLELRDEEAKECSVATDPRLQEWFRRPPSPLKSGKLAWLGASVASAAAKERRVARSGFAQKKEPASLPATLRKSISELFSFTCSACRMASVKWLAGVLGCSLVFACILGLLGRHFAFCFTARLLRPPKFPQTFAKGYPAVFTQFKCH